MPTESFFTQASLAYLASAGAGKDGKTYSMKPTDGTGDFTFSRGSNLSATRISANGLIEKGRENLLLQSNQFDTTWALNTTSVTSGQSGYDGSSDAWLLNSTGTGFPRIQGNVSTSGVFVFSVYAKAATDGFMLLRTSGANSQVWFDLSDGSILNSTGSEYISSTTEDVGNGWYRYSILANGSLTNVRIYPASAYGVYSTSGNGIYIQDSQVEVGTLATEVIESGATTGKAGLLEDEPRFDYSGGATCPSLLLEPSRTNLYPYSEYSGVWSKTSWTTTDNYAISPEGVQNAFRAVSSNKSGIMYISGTGTTGQDNTLSVWAKSNTGSDQKFRFWGNGNTTTSNDFTATNEWQRFDFTYNCTNVTAGIKGASSELSDILFYGFHHEAGSYPTSYIPNHSGGTITRGVDAISKNLTSVIDNNQMTMFVDVKSLTSITTVIAADGFGDLRWYHQAGNRFRFYKIDDADWLTNSFVVNDGDKIALTLTDTQAKLFVNGVQVGTTFTLTTSFQNFSNLNYNVGSSKNEWNQFLIFSTPLSDADCITLTT